jgi:hypothetical protein
LLLTMFTAGHFSCLNDHFQGTRLTYFITKQADG